MSDGRRAVRDVSRSHQLYTAGGMPARQTLREWISLQSIESHVMTLDAARVRDAPSGERADLMRSVVLALDVDRIPRITFSGPESHAAQSDAWPGLRHQESVWV